MIAAGRSLGAAVTTSPPGFVLGWRIGSGVALALALLLVWYAWHLQRMFARAQVSWPRVEGVVVRDEDGLSEESRVWVRFTTQDGRTITGTPHGGQVGRRRGDHTGARVPVWYDPEYPRTFFAQVRPSDNRYWRLGAVGVLVAAFVVPFVVAGIGMHDPML